ncbi:MAG: succinate dehydrogenase, hydrophobic membrane anchor protein [Burkholderiaceae bacterium]|jgi:succinate dehydrogenase / fumarate reductase membrane anchor subunit|nr:succinate dehydrogenase, hydrophobic membrane anchor protein [Burkholderiaceae bacterium]MEB2319843.1 succinate dehydrogenase, hydrophobic membrane anchor protein [Pseudomonadota bacterium]
MSVSRTVVGAHYGWRDFAIQRLSGVVIIVFTLWLLIELLMLPALTYGNWAGLFATMRMKVVTSVAMLALAYHAWIGVRDIFMDYIKPAMLRLALQSATIVVLVGYVVWAFTILWRV